MPMMGNKRRLIQFQPIAGVGRNTALRQRFDGLVNQDRLVAQLLRRFRLIKQMHIARHEQCQPKRIPKEPNCIRYLTI